MTQPILNSNVVTSIDHKAGSSPVLGQIPEHTQDELKALSHERWAGVCLPSNEALNNFGYHIAMGLSALNDITSEDRIAVMKLTDGFLTTAENKRDATEDYANGIKKKLQQFMDRIHDGGDINTNEQMEMEENIAKLRQQYAVLNCAVNCLTTVRERMLSELNLQNWPKRHDRQHTKQSRASVNRLSADDPRMIEIMKSLRLTKKPSTVPYTPQHNGVDCIASKEQYEVAADYEIQDES